MGHIFTTLNRSYSSITGITVNVAPLFGQEVLGALCTYMKDRPAVVLGTLLTAINAWTHNPVADAVSRVSAALVVSLAFYGMPIISLARRASLALRISTVELFQAVYGTIMDPTFKVLLCIQAVYMITGAERAQWLTRLGVVDAPAPGQTLWKFARVLDPETMTGCGGDVHDTALLFFIKLHDAVKPAEKIEPNYRKLASGLDSAQLDLLVDQVKQMFSSLAGGDDDVGPAIKAVRKALPAKDAEQAAPAAAPRKRLQIDQPAAASVAQEDEDMEEM